MAKTRSKKIARKRTAQRGKNKKKISAPRRKPKKSKRGTHTQAALARANTANPNSRRSTQKNDVVMVENPDLGPMPQISTEEKRSFLASVIDTVKTTVRDIIPSIQAQPAPIIQVPQRPEPVQNTTPAIPENNALTMLSEIMAEKNDEQAQQTRKIASTIEKLKRNDYASTDAVLAVARKNFGQHLYSDGKRVTTAPKTKTFRDIMSVALTRGKYYLEETKDINFGINLVNWGLKQCEWYARYTEDSMVAYEDINAMNAAVERRYVGDCGNTYADYLERKCNRSAREETVKPVKSSNVAGRDRGRKQSRTKTLPCFRFLQGKCPHSASECAFSHDFTLQKPTSDNNRNGRRNNKRER